MREIEDSNSKLYVKLTTAQTRIPKYSLPKHPSVPKLYTKEILATQPINIVLTANLRKK